jgi:hypothetical protein
MRLAPPDLSEPLRTAIIGVTAITRRPVPDDAPARCIVVSPDITVENADGVNSLLPIITRDVTVYGPNVDYRVVEDLGRQVVKLFHNTRNSIVVPSWGVTLVTTVGPLPAPADDDETIARVVEVRVSLSAKG